MYSDMEDFIKLGDDLKLFLSEFGNYLSKKLHFSYIHIEENKNAFVTSLYKQRGRLSRKLIHTGMAGLVGVGMVIAPSVAQEFPGRSVNPWEVEGSPQVLSATSESDGIETLFSEKVRDGIKEYKVEEGDTVASIAKKFGIDENTIRWQNNLTSDKIKVGQILQILPVTGIAHKVVKGDTVYSIAKRYDTEAQGIVDFPFNTFSNDETFELAIGQIIIVPDGVKPAEVVAAPRIRQITPDAGSVVASGNFVWPTQGVLTQYFSWYHPGLDIANRAVPNVLAADSGTVIYAGCINWGYGCHVRVDHGNGYTTLYAHLQQIYVTVGQRVSRGNTLGKMGSTGRSTGPHLHFEVARNGVKLSPLTVLK